jgi:hypothetical protein
MTLFKRHFRRAAGVGVGVALLVLGLEGPAFAAAPTVTSFTPGSGPTNCVVVITGTAFTDFPASATNVGFLPSAGPVIPATDFAVISATEIWATVPALTAGASYKVEVKNAGGTADSATTFLSTTAAGACAPTITGFTPTCGSAGTTVVITGTNLLRDTAAGPDGGEVRFNPYTASEIATHTVPDVDTATSVSVLVPTTAADGPVQVTTFAASGGSVFSTAAFNVPPPDCTPVGPTVHKMSVTLRLSDSLNAAGHVSVGDGFADCRDAVKVKIQRKVNGVWKTIRSATTTATGKYAGHLKNKHGKYRTLAPKLTLNSGADVCAKAVSPVRKH